MSLLEEQFELLKREFPDATLQPLPSGAALIAIPNYRLLASGWSRETTTVKLLAPVGFPFAKPDCFWINQEVRLKNGTMPQSSNITPIPETNEPHLWFSWHVGQWNPNRDNLLTYVRVIDKRLRDPR